jgi:hypothetical protein
LVKYLDGEERSLKKKIKLDQIKYFFIGTGTSGKTQFYLENYTGSSTSFKWNFDDNVVQTTSDPQVTHTFTDRGLKNVTLEFNEGDKNYKLVTVANIYMPEIEFVEQPFGLVPRGEDLVYKINCNIGDMKLSNTSYVKFYTSGLDSSFTCTGINSVKLPVGVIQHTVTCTPKPVSCPYNIHLGNVFLNVICGVFDNEEMKASSDSTNSEAVSVDFSVPGGCY